MAEKKTENQDIDIASTYSKLEKYMEDNKQVLTYVIGGIAIVIAAYFGYSRFIVGPKEDKAADLIFRAQTYFGVDSLKLALNGDGLYPGFLELIDDYSGTKAANTSHYYAGLCYLKMGQYEDAVKYLKGFESDDAYAQTLAYGGIGDAYAEMGQLDNGISWYEKAANNSPNELLTPFFLYKAGLAMERNKNYSDAKRMFSKIKNDYPDSPEGAEIDKYIARVEAKL